MNQLVKKLQELYAWSQFYSENKREKEYEDIQIEIKEHKSKMKDIKRRNKMNKKKVFTASKSNKK